MIYDTLRTEELMDLGLTVLRFRNEEVRNRMEYVLERIRDFLMRPELP